MQTFPDAGNRFVAIHWVCFQPGADADVDARKSPPQRALFIAPDKPTSLANGRLDQVRHADAVEHFVKRITGTSPKTYRIAERAAD